jgi:two-component system chemotaxis response regulator CheB
MDTRRKIRVLIVDDSAIVRRALSDIINSHSDLEVAGTAADPFIARDKILALKPDVLTLDIEMPRMDGLTFLKKLMRFHPLPVVVISSLGQSSSRAAIEALQFGAVDVMAKPNGPYSVTDLGGELALKLRAAAHARLRYERAAEPVSSTPAPDRRRAQAEAIVHQHGPIDLIAIGASTGGVEALRSVLVELPEQMPPIVIVQHIPPVFSTEFAARLDRLCRLRVKEAQDGDDLTPGQVLIAPGGLHLSIRRSGGRFRAAVHGGDPVHFQRPAVDVLFDSVACSGGRRVIGAILTGMGTDGAAGMLAMKRAGARTIAQNEASCVVFGMPREAIRLGGVDQVLPVDRIASELVRLVSGPVQAVEDSRNRVALR